MLFSKKIGIVGLSVGQSIALNLALERLCGELRLADFDTLDLSNLNRMRTPIYEIGNNKAIIAARQIAEIDPFIKVKIFTDGITTDNIDDFFDTDGKLDLLIEECDSLDVKVDLRLAAKKREIPVVMDTNDRGMIDIERFDKEPERSIFHGLIDDIKPDELHNLTPAEKVPYVMRIIGSKLLSARLQISLPEIGKSLSTWPQLASDVALGSALASDVTRRILLAQSINSGRYYVDLEELVGKTDHSYCFN